MTRNVYIETYGCQMNVADTELMYGVLKDNGFGIATSIDDADVVLLNTCAVREKAEERVFGRATQLLRYKYEKPELIMGITGCMAEHLQDKILERAPYIDIVVGPDAYRRLPELLKNAAESESVVDVRLDKNETYEGLAASRREGVSGWVTIQRGCDKFCTFCIVPYVRGRERGTAPREVLRQVRDLADMGYKEVTLLGQTVNSYAYEDVDFADLLEAVAQVEGIERIRYTSPYPIDFSQKLIDTLARIDKIPNYLHLPLQSGSNKVLEHMKRGYTVEAFRDIVQRLRVAMPDIALSTDIIVGFPDETNEEFEQTLEVLREFQFDYAFMFAYSEREGTVASKRIPDTITPEEKSRRLSALIEVQNAITRSCYEARIGTIEEVLVDSPAKRGPDHWCGRSPHFKNVVFPAFEGIRPGMIVQAEIARASVNTLYSDRVIGRERLV